MGGVLAAPVLPTINLFINSSSISPPSGGGVRREKDETKEGKQMAIGLRTLGIPGLVGSKARQSRSAVPLCFAQKQALCF